MKKLTYSLTICILIFTSCKRECKYESYPEVETCANNETCVEDIRVIDIYKSALTYHSEYVITNDSIYDAVKSFDSINGINWPVIDFDKEILIGKYTESSGCSMKTSYKLTKSSNGYLLNIRNVTHGNCDMLIMKTHWLQVPRLNNVNVSFNVINNEC